jgi:hypothetical protein
VGFAAPERWYVAPSPQRVGRPPSHARLIVLFISDAAHAHVTRLPRLAWRCTALQVSIHGALSGTVRSPTTICDTHTHNTHTHTHTTATVVVNTALFCAHLLLCSANGAPSVMKSEACGSSRASCSLSFDCTFLLARTEHTHIPLFTNNTLPQNTPSTPLARNHHTHTSVRLQTTHDPRYTINTCGSSYDTYLHVYQRTAGNGRGQLISECKHFSLLRSLASPARTQRLLPI